MRVICALLSAVAALAASQHGAGAPAASRCDPPPGDAALAAALRSGSSIFFVRAISASGVADVSDVERCAVEAAAAMRPARPVVYYVANLDCSAAPVLTSLLADADNLWVVRLDFAALFKPYVGLSAWYAGFSWAVPEPRTRGAHLSDAARLVLVHQHGGLYMDSDELMLRPSSLADVPDRAMGAEKPFTIASAFLAFPAGHPFLGAAIAEFAASFRADAWGWNGPGLVGRVWAALSAGGSNAVNITILAPHEMYPLPYEVAGALFQPLADAPAAVSAEVCRARGLHLWNHVMGPRLHDVGECSADAEAFPATLLGRVMASSCPRTLNGLRARCGLPRIATVSAAVGWHADLCAGTSAPALPVAFSPFDGEVVAVRPENMTLTAWVRGPVPTFAQAVILPEADADCVTLGLDCSAAACRVSVRAGSEPLLFSARNLVPGRWHFVALTGSAGGVFTLYLDGVQQLLSTPTARAGTLVSSLQADAVLPMDKDFAFVDLAPLAGVTAIARAAMAPSALSFAALTAEHNAQRGAFEPPALAASESASDAIAVPDAEVDIVGLVQPDWTGVLHSHQRVPAFFGKTLLVRSLEHEPSSSALLARLAAMPALRSIVVNCVLDGTGAFAERLRAVRPDVDFAVVVHSAPSSPYHFLEAEQIARVVRAAQPRADGSPSAVTRMGFVKFGMAQLFRALGVCAYDLTNFPPTHAEHLLAAASAPAPTAYAASAAATGAARPVHILIPGIGDAKNQAAQILAACVLPDVVVHVIQAPTTAYLRACPAPLVVHGKLSAAAFAALLARMDVLSYISLTECSPGVVLESVAAGVPCLAGATSPIYASDTSLSEMLVVNAPDDPAAISAAFARVIDVVRDKAAATKLRSRLLTLAVRATDFASATWSAFIDGRNASSSCPAAAAGSANAFVSLETAVNAAGGDVVNSWSVQQPMLVSGARRLDDNTSSYSYTPSYSFTPSASSVPIATPSSSATPISAGYTVSTISLATMNVTCATAQSPITLALLLANFSSSPQFAGIPSSWITDSALCGNNTRRLQTAPAPFTVVFIFTISAPNNANPALIASAAAAVTAASGASAATFTALMQAVLPGATVSNVAATVNGVICGTTTSPACSSLFPSTSPGSTLNVGAVIGGVIGGVAALAIFVALVVVCKRRDSQSQTAAGSGAGLAAGAPVSAPAAVPQHISAASAYKPASV